VTHTVETIVDFFVIFCLAYLGLVLKHYKFHAIYLAMCTQFNPVFMHIIMIDVSEFL